MNLEIGSTVGDYQIVDILGAGGMGKVFKVRNTISDRIEAMKVLLPDLAGEPDLADRFLREIKVLASLDHPNIAGLRTALRFENQLYMIMEFVEGHTLDERLRSGPLPLAEAVNSIDQVLSALGYAHSRGVIHRDIKPANMMLMSNGTVKLMDFGIAKGATDRKLTMTGTTMGSLYYMSPEQIRGVQTLDSRSDLYSLGVTLYELLTGKRPFDGDSQFAIMSAHLEKTPVPPISIDPRLPQALNDLILFSVNREPEGRFQNAGAFQKALQSVTGKPAAPAVVAAPVPTPQPAPKPVAASPSHAPATAGGSRRWLWAAIGGLACVAALVAVIQFGPKKNADAGTSPAPPPAATNPAPEASPAAGTVPSASPASSVPAEAVPPAASPKTIPAPQVQKGARDSSHSAPQSQAVSTTPASAVPQTVTAPQQAVPQPVDPRPSAPPPAQPDTSAKRAELMKLRESAALVSARAVSIHTTLQNMQRSQAASGLGMRSDWVQSATMMDTFLRASNDALAAGDTEAAKDYIDKAERQVEKLEKALNK